MAIAFPVTLPLPFGEYKYSKPDKRFMVYGERDGDHYEVWIKDHKKGTYVPFSIKSTFALLNVHRIGLHWYWFQPSSPGERILLATEKAQRKADKLNDREMYQAHEAEIGQRYGL